MPTTGAAEASQQLPATSKILGQLAAIVLFFVVRVGKTLHGSPPYRLRQRTAAEPGRFAPEPNGRIGRSRFAALFPIESRRRVAAGNSGDA